MFVMIREGKTCLWMEISTSSGLHLLLMESGKQWFEHTRPSIQNKGLLLLEGKDLD
jgi:hypothetical protein